MKVESYIQEAKNAAEALRNHGVVAFPTETVMGLAVIYSDFEAYTKLNIIKQRPESKPYTMMLKDIKQMYQYAEVSKKVENVIKTFMPGPLTVLLPSKNVPGYVTHNSGIIGMRIPTNKEALALLNEINIPLLVPSANISGFPPCKSSDEVKKVFQDKLDFIVNGECKIEQPSTIVDLSKDEPILLREGPIKFEEIIKLLK